MQGIGFLSVFSGLGGGSYGFQAIIPWKDIYNTYLHIFSQGIILSAYRFISTTVVLLLAGGIFLLISTGNARGAQVSATIELDHPVQTAHVGPGENGTVNFTGTVTAEATGPGDNVQSIQITLDAASQWPTTISPTSLTIQASQQGVPVPFEVTVRVPNFTSAAISGEVIVSGSVRTLPGAPITYSIPEARGIINIAPYAMLSVQCNDPSQEARPGDTVVFHLDLQNNGNYYDNVSMELEEDEGWMFNGWNIDYPINDISFDIGASETVEVKASIPKNAPEQFYSFLFDFTSHSGNDTDTKSYKLFLNVTGPENGVVGGNGGGGSNGHDDAEKDGLPRAEGDESGRSIPGFGIHSVFIAVLALLPLSLVRSHGRR